MDRSSTPRSAADIARVGDLDALGPALEHSPETKRDRETYKWLCAARDFGHEEADDLIDDLLEHTTMRYDDSAFERAGAHWELAAAYLEGTSGLPRNLDHARNHLELAFEHHPDLATINAGTGETYSADDLLARLDGPARSLLQTAIAGDDLARATRVLDRLRRLLEVRAPEVMVEDHRRLLRELVARICPEPDAAYISRMGFDPLVDELALTETTVAAQIHKLELLRAEHARRLQERLDR